MTKENPETIAEYKDALDTALAKIQSLETNKTKIEKQLDESTEAMIIIKKQFDAAESTEKEAVIDELVRDSQGKLAKDTLSTHNLKELYFLKDNLDRAEPKSFVSVMKQREADQNKPKTQDMSLVYDSAKKDWMEGPK